MGGCHFIHSAHGRAMCAQACLAVLLVSTLIGMCSGQVKPAALPERMLWRLTLIEHHPSAGANATDEAFGNYYFDWSTPIVSVRQENSFSFVSWRPDIPWNVFWGDEGRVAAAYLDTSDPSSAAGSLQCTTLPFVYDRAFWPRSFLTSNCTASSASPLAMPSRFGGRFYDGVLAFPLACTLSDGTGSMAIKPTVWLSPADGSVLRFDVTTPTPGWNAQTWDVLEQVPVPDLPPTFMRLPAYCNASLS
eukprot:TRINITY_DN7865_c0_g1_i2.p1 TRINITY_DN7865_c0_g1~~TRINITY_DN7865_c0_g1_i2.p1  ORF type:complete len:262 (-),score=58.59 TRINITY_DN7865_c0_g1_i2:515-1255(-)